MDVSSLFPAAAETTYLNTASMALGNRASADAVATAMQQWVDGTFDWTEAERTGEALRARVASLLGATTDDMAFVAGASGGASTVAAQLPVGGPGANVVVPAREFASNFLPWQLLHDRGYELRTVEDVDGVVSLDRFAELVDANTAVVATSLVQSTTGFVVDLDGLKDLAADAGAWLVVDASQGFGAVPFDVDGLAAVFSCSHKWMLGVRGIGHLYLRPDLRDRFGPVVPGWKSIVDPVHTFYGPTELSPTASKFDVSWPWINPIADLAAVDIIEGIGIDAIAAHNRGLVERLESHGIAVPFDPARRSSIVSLTVDDADSLVDAFEAEQIVASARAGRVRVSFHLYNTPDDVDRLVKLLQL